MLGAPPATAKFEIGLPLLITPQASGSKESLKVRPANVLPAPFTNVPAICEGSECPSIVIPVGNGNAAAPGNGSGAVSALCATEGARGIGGIMGAVERPAEYLHEQT